MPYNRLVIIDYGMSNLRSVYKRLKRLGIDAVISSNNEIISNADKLILPGVGHFAKAMDNMKKLNLIELLNKKVIDQKIPILGICLGMQLFTNYSEEGNVNGLGWINAETKHFNISTERLKIPHMGWNNIVPTKPNKIFEGLEANRLFYFVHSYHVVCNDNEDILASTKYGYEFTSAIYKDNIIGVQFHPEKSHEWGANILLNFIKM